MIAPPTATRTATPAYLATLELERRRRTRDRAEDIGQSWQYWTKTLFPSLVTQPFAPHHEVALDWFWTHKAGRPQKPLIVILPRGGGKSTMAELGTVMVGALESRRFVLYVRSTQDQADASVYNISALMESRKLAQYYPEFADRAIDKYGNPRGWNRTQLYTASGFFVNSFGLDVAKRGIRVEEYRPDLIIFDDVDELQDTPTETARKINLLTMDLLPTGTSVTSVFGCQNLMLPSGVFAQIADGSADFLRSAKVVGPIKAIEDMTYEKHMDEDTARYVYKITGGTPSWVGQDIDKCTTLMNLWGPFSFLKEAQHEVNLAKGSKFDGITFRTCDRVEVPPLKRVVTWVDPSISTTDRSDSCAIVVAGIDFKKTIYVLHAWEARSSPTDVIQRAIQHALAYKSETVGVETDQGGDTWRSVFEVARKNVWEQNPDLKNVHPPRFTSIKSGKFRIGKTTLSKSERVDRILITQYEAGSIIHVAGTTAMLEAALLRFPISKPFDLVDALALAVNDLSGGFKYRAGTW